MTTNVLWAGQLGSRGVVSIFSNPDGQTGSNGPLNSPLTYLDRVYFDTRFNYLNIIAEADFSRLYNFVDVNRQSSGKKGKSSSEVPIEGSNITKIYDHGLGYVPGCILYDLDTNDALSGNVFVQNIDNTSFRLLYLLADENSFYIREKYFVRLKPLPSITKKYRLLVFNNPAEVPAYTL